MKLRCLKIFLALAGFILYFSQAIFAQESLKIDRVILSWTSNPDTTQTITWIMPTDFPAYVQYIEKDKFKGNFNNAKKVEVKGVPFDSVNYRYSVTLTGLRPGTQYVYRVGSEGMWSDVFTFATAPADAESFAFLYLGDVQSGFSEWRSMLEEINRKNPQLRFALLGGDLTEKESDEGEWSEFLKAAAALFSKIPVMPTLGNHDGSAYLKFFALPDNGPEDLKKEFYSFDYGNAHFVVLNSNKNADERAKEWLRKDLENTNKKWRFAVFHHPPYPAVADYKGIDESIRKNWVPLLEQYNVDMVFVGHQHVYMRTKPLRDGQIHPDGDGVVYVMGNSGTKHYGSYADFEYIAKLEASMSNYQIVKIDGDILTLTSLGVDGQVIDTYTIVKRSSDVEKLKSTPTNSEGYRQHMVCNFGYTPQCNYNSSGYSARIYKSAIYTLNPCQRIYGRFPHLGKICDLGAKRSIQIFTKKGGLVYEKKNSMQSSIFYHCNVYRLTRQFIDSGAILRPGQHRCPF